MKVHLSLPVRDLAASVAFYRVLLDVEPAKRIGGYALFATDDPALELALVEERAQTIADASHYGLVVETSDAVDVTANRLHAAGYMTDTERAQTCCYAVQDKVWAADPDGRRWETYHVLAETDEPIADGGACC